MASRSAKRNVRRFGIAGLTAAGAALAIVAVAHTPAGRPLLSWMGRTGGCPIAGRSPAELEAARVTAMAPLRGSARAPTKRALDFVLMVSTEEEVRQRQSAQGCTCSAELAGAGMRCVTADGDDLFFRFDGKGALVGVDVMHAMVSLE